MVSIPYELQLSRSRYNDHYILYASKQLAPYEYWTANIQKVFTLQMNRLRLSVFDLQTEESNPNLSSVKEKRVTHETHKRFWDNPSPEFTKKFIS